MSVLSAVDLSKSFGPVDIFKGISLDIPHGARIAIVGSNGIGKTTLLRVLLGIEEPTSGTLHRARGIQVGYLAQEASLSSEQTLWQECLSALADLRSLEAELTRLEAAMSDASQAEAALERYGQIQVEFERLGGYTYETRIRQTLTGLGFEARDYHRPLYQLSGGQRTRALLARLLLANPDLLILDEPTNHLDIAAVEWLEGYLSQWPGSVLIVSHDRYFLDRVVNHIWEMSGSGLETYRGNYTAYVQDRQNRWELRQQSFESEKERLLKELDYIKRNISGQNTLQAKGKLRRLSREIQAIEQLGIEAVQKKNWLEITGLAEINERPMNVDEVERRIRGLKGPRNRPPVLHLHLKASHRSGDIVLRTSGVAIGYPDEGRPLFRCPDLVLKRTECAAIIGPNGAGKTTFLKTLLQKMPPLEGEVELGASLNVGYFAQAHEDLNPQRTLIDEINSIAPNMLPAEVRDYLARFLFTGDDVFKLVAVLSGGERGRLALAKLALSRANLLLLDEPTNHLDIPSQEILQDVLSDYPGTILLVSHDRYLIDALGSQIWEIRPDEAWMEVFEGSYSQYREYHELCQAEQAAQEALQRARAGQKNRPAQASGEERQRRQRLKVVEERIADLEALVAELSRKLENPPSDPAQVQRLGVQYVKSEEELNSLLSEWEELQTQT